MQQICLNSCHFDQKGGEFDMKRLLQFLGRMLAAISPKILSTATLGYGGEVEPPECLK